MAPPAEQVRTLLGRAIRRHRRISLLAVLLGALAVLLLAALIAGGLLALQVRPAPVRWTVRLLVLVGSCVSVVLGFRANRRDAGSEGAAARLLAPFDPGLRSALHSALELSRAREGLVASGAASAELIDAHVGRTAAALAPLDLAAVIPDRPVRLAAAALGGTVLLTAAALLGFGAPLARGMTRLVQGDPPALLAPSLDPITGDIELSFRYPAHTHRPPHLLSGTGGEIRAPRGTEVGLRARADRQVERAELELTGPAGTVSARVALTVKEGRELAGTLVLLEGGSYRFRFADARGRTLAEGPPIPLVVEPDAFPMVRITAPAAELEVRAGEVVRVEWAAEDDYGLGALTLVLLGPTGQETRRPVRALAGLRHDQGGFDLPLAAERLGEGERLRYWLEVEDNDAISGPKKGASATQVIKIYSEAEHARAAMEKARAAWEQLVALLGERLELLAGGPVTTAARLPLATAQDARTRQVVEELRKVSAELRREKAVAPELAQALANVAASLRTAEQRATAVRQAAGRALAAGQPVDAGSTGQVAWADGLLVAELERSILYLEQLFDKARAEQLVRMTRELGARKRELQAQLEKLRDAPSDQARQEALAQLKRLKARLDELLARMAETARGFHDEHMNAEAMAELSKQGDMHSPLDAIEKALQRGDVAGAMKALDQLGSQLDQLAAGLEKTAGEPDEKQRALMREMMAFKEQLDQVQKAQQETAERTERVKNDVRQRLAPQLEQARQGARALEQEARAATEELKQARPNVPPIAATDLDAAENALADLQRSLALRDLEAASESANRALAPALRLGVGGQRVARIRDQLARLTPDPRQAMTPGDKQRLAELAGQQRSLELKAGELQQKLSQLMEQAPIFPPQAQGQLGESRGHMGAAAGELQQRNPQRGHGEQQAALEGLERFRQGLEQVAKGARGGQGGGFPFPFGESGTGGGEREGDWGDPAAQKVVIPGSEAHRLPEAFRRDLLEAMKQGSPERYRGEVQRYYEELVK